MVSLPELKKLEITKEEGLNRGNIDRVIDVLLDTPKEVFGKDRYSLSKLELLDLYYTARTIFRTRIDTTRVWFQINCFMETDQVVEEEDWVLVRDLDE